MTELPTGAGIRCDRGRDEATAVATIRDVRRLVILAILIGFVIWRGRTLDRYDRVHGYGPYAPVRPTDTT